MTRHIEQWADKTVFNVKDFGAVGDGVADDTAAIQAAITACGGANRVVFFPGGQYKISTSLNATSVYYVLFTGIGVESQIKGNCTGKSIFDCTGSYGHIFEKLWIQGDGTNIPQSAFLFARKTGNASAGIHTLRDLNINGTYSIADVISISSEVNVYDNIICTNDKNAASTYCFAITEQNDTSAVSDYQTFPSPFAGGNTVHKFVSGYVSHQGGHANCSGMLLADIRDISFSGTFFGAGTSYAGIYVSGDVSGFSLLGCSAEWNSATYGIYIASAKTLSDGIITGSFDQGIYGADTSILENIEVRAPLYDSPAVNVYDMYDCTISTSALGVTVRNTSKNNLILGTTADTSISLPSDTRSNIVCDYKQRSDGQYIYRLRTSDHGTYSRLKSKYVHTDVLRTTVQAVTTVGGGTITCDPTAGGAYTITLDGNLTINSPTTLAAPVAAGNALWDEGTTVTFIFHQDGTGNRTVTWGYLFEALGWQPTAAAYSTSSITFMLDCKAQTWVRISGPNNFQIAGGIAVNTISPPSTVYVNSYTTGTLGAGTYYYQITAYNDKGESIASSEFSGTLAAPGGIQLFGSSVPNAIGYKYYGRTTGAGKQLLYTSSNPTVRLWTDDGSLTPSGAMPTTNTTANSTFAGNVTITGTTDAPNIVQQIRVSFAHDTGGGTASSTATIPAGAYIEKSNVVITEAFNGTTPTLAVDVYNVGGSATLQTTSDNNPKVIGQNAMNDSIPVTNAGPVKVTITPDGSTTGEGYVIVSYSVPRT